MEQFLAILEKFGPWVALALFLVWAQWKREQRADKREDRMAKALDDQHEQFGKVIERVTRAVEQSTETQRTLIRVLNERPCIMDDDETHRTQAPPEHMGNRRYRTPLPATDIYTKGA